MKNKVVVIPMLLILLLTIMPMALRLESASAIPSYTPSLVVHDAINKINAILGIKSSSQVTSKGVITNVGTTTLTGLLTAVFFKEDIGTVQPSDMTFEWSPDCLTWYSVHPSEVKVADPATGYHVELIIGPLGGESLNPSDSREVYIRATYLQDLTPTSYYSIAVIVFNDANGNRHWNPGEMIYSQPPSSWDYPIKIDLAIMHSVEIGGTGLFYYNIQNAINVASPEDTIIVYDGTYDEQVVINKSLTLQGGSTPIIKPSSAAILTTVLDGLFWGGTKQIAGIIVANAAGGSVTVKNIIVDGENIIAKPPGADYVAGIFYRETGGTIDTVTVANMTIGSTGTAVRGYGVYLSAITYTVLVEIEYCTITNYDKNAIDVHGDKLTINIHDNTLTGRRPLPNGDEVQNGVVVMDGATGTVDYNDISNMAYIPETWWSAGIMFLESDGSAEGNIITNCQIGIIFQDGSGSAQTNTVAGGTVGLLGIWAQYTTAGTWTANFVGNTISGVRDSPGYENGAIGAQSWDAGSSLVVTIHNNKLLGDGSTSADGIYIGDVPEYEPAGNIQAIITSNTISGWQNGIHLVSSVDAGSISNNNITDTYLGIFVESATSVQICNNRLIDFVKGGIVTRGAKNIFIDGNTISTTLHDEAPNGIDIGTYTGTSGTVKGNKISGCSWKGFTGDYETSWSGSGILVIESGDSLEIIGNIVHDCDVGMDIESDSMKITCNDVHNNIYGFVFWNANPKVNYNNIYSNTQYGFYRTTMGNLMGVLDARYNWWGHASGPTHPSNPGGTGDRVSDYVWFSPWLFTEKVPPLVHDVAIIKVVPSAIRVIIGTPIQFDVTAKNEGTAYENFTVTLYYDSNIIDTQAITDLTPGATKLLTFNWDTIGVTPGDYTIKAEASTVPGETDVADNVKTAMVRIGTAPTIKVEPSTYTAKLLGERFTINITMNNLKAYWRVVGLEFRISYNNTLLKIINVEEGPFLKDPRWNRHGTFFIYFIERKTVLPNGTIIPPHILIGLLLFPNATGQWEAFPSGNGTLATITFEVIYQDRGYDRRQGYITPPLSCDFKLFSSRILDDDGEFIPHLAGHGLYTVYPTNIADVNYDGYVGIDDIFMISTAFGEEPSRSRWNPDLDLNKDDYIGIDDIWIAASNFGWEPDP
jgi:hypothetical protein